MQRNVSGEITAAVLLVLLLGVVGLSAVLLATVSDGRATPAAVAVSPVTVVVVVTETPSSNEQVTATDTPTATQTDTPTQMASATRTATETLTPTPSVTNTDAPTRTDTPTQTESATPSPTETATMTPTQHPTATASASDRLVSSRCDRPRGWAIYTVERGSTLFSIARAVDSTVGELRTVNCLSNVDNIIAGQTLFVPRLPDGPVKTSVPRALPPNVGGLGRQGCTDAQSVVSAPRPGQRVSGSFDVYGSAYLDEMTFQYYKLEVRPDFADVYNFYSRSEQAVENGRLGHINADLFDDGVHWVRLVVVDKTGNFIEPCVIPVIFD